ncbi:ATP/GTP-binding protein [Corynebacterium qintianiae]|uniref:ATP/GTP-binding protein n=1 Tax=Corynebacterium qintianiae TaxID=2709392 RepID=A0A7T0PDB2_9CORY|nr:ATP/GTP-binding protein [Corynebacterium qintianiae]QPK82768.1 ATP/GTP-binding protein [Corynebacterium qintianiae]
MAHLNDRKVNQELAVFGESGSGKTVLASVFYGRATDPSVEFSDHYTVRCTDATHRTKLFKDYLGMAKEDTPPRPDKFRASQYPFRIALKSPEETGEVTLKSVDLTWHDYPGEWFEQTTSGPEEERRRINTFKALLESDVALILVDADKLNSYQGEEDRYLKSLFGNFRSSIQNLEDELLSDEKKLVNFPRIWVITLSKADVMPEMSAIEFKELVVLKAGDELNELRSVLQKFALGGKVSLGEDFLLLSSAKFSPGDVDTTTNIGLDVIVPLATLLPVERFAKIENRKLVPVEKLARAANAVAALTEDTPSVVKAIGAVAGRLARALPIPVPGFAAQQAFLEAFLAAATFGAERLRELEAEARQNKSYAQAALLGMQRGLAEAEEKGILLRATE